MRQLSEIVHFRSHVQRVARGSIAERDVYGQTVIVQAAAVFRVAHIYGLARAAHHVVHLLLHRHGACRIADAKTKVGTQALEFGLCLFQRGCCRRVQVGCVQISVKHLACEVIGTRVHQAYPNARVDRLDVHKALPLYAALRGGLLLCLTIRRQGKGEGVQ